jgi:prepilin-type N-terminal cleavage/methylation domain-containing protein
MKIQCNDGFSLVELIIVIVIVGILALLAVPTYQKYIRKSLAAEGKALVTAAANAEKVYYVDYHAFAVIPPGTNGSANNWLGINCQTNLYFKTYKVDSPTGQSYTVQTDAAANTDATGLTVKGVGDTSNAVVVTVLDGGTVLQ